MFEVPLLCLHVVAVLPTPAASGSVKFLDVLVLNTFVYTCTLFVDIKECYMVVIWFRSKSSSPLGRVRIDPKGTPLLSHASTVHAVIHSVCLHVVLLADLPLPRP